MEVGLPYSEMPCEMSSYVDDFYSDLSGESHRSSVKKKEPLLYANNLGGNWLLRRTKWAAYWAPPHCFASFPMHVAGKHTGHKTWNRIALRRSHCVGIAFLFPASKKNRLKQNEALINHDPVVPSCLAPRSLDKIGQVCWLSLLSCLRHCPQPSWKLLGHLSAKMSHNYVLTWAPGRQTGLSLLTMSHVINLPLSPLLLSLSLPVTPEALTCFTAPGEAIGFAHWWAVTQVDLAAFFPQTDSSSNAWERREGCIRLLSVKMWISLRICIRFS